MKCHAGGFTGLQHALCEWLSVEGISGGVKQVAQDDGSIHYVARRQNHGVSHQRVHQRVCCNKDKTYILETVGTSDCGKAKAKKVSIENPKCEFYRFH